MELQKEAELTSVELMRQVMAASQFFRDHPVYDEDNYDPDYEAKDEAMGEAQAEAMVEGSIEAVNAYLGRVDGEDITLAVHTLVHGLAKRALVLLMFHLMHKLGHFPSREEMEAELDSDEWAALDES